MVKTLLVETPLLFEKESIETFVLLAISVAALTESENNGPSMSAVSYTHLRAHET